MLSKDKKYFALDRVIFELGETIVHKNLGYTATIKKFLAAGNAMIEIPDTPENMRIWAPCKLPMTFKATNIAKTFKHQIYEPTIF